MSEEKDYHVTNRVITEGIGVVRGIVTDDRYVVPANRFRSDFFLRLNRDAFVRREDAVMNARARVLNKLESIERQRASLVKLLESFEVKS
jgi:hypothetical protein